jgi:hypothetical protein
MKKKIIGPVIPKPVNHPNPLSLYTIPLEEAIQWTSAWRAARGSGAVRSFRIDVAELQEIISERGCMYMRVYFGMNSEGDEKLVLVGVNEHDRDMISKVYDFTQPCPSTCDNSSPLSGVSNIPVKGNVKA